MDNYNAGGRPLIADEWLLKCAFEEKVEPNKNIKMKFAKRY